MNHHGHHGPVVLFHQLSTVSFPPLEKSEDHPLARMAEAEAEESAGAGNMWFF